MPNVSLYCRINKEMIKNLDARDYAFGENAAKYPGQAEKKKQNEEILREVPH